MITVILLNILLAIVNGIIYLFSTLGPIEENDAIVQSISEISLYISPLNNIIPIDTILQILLFEIVFETAYLTYKLIRWGYQKIPMIN